MFSVDEVHDLFRAIRYPEKDPSWINKMIRTIPDTDLEDEHDLAYVEVLRGVVATFSYRGLVAARNDLRGFVQTLDPMFLYRGIIDDVGWKNGRQWHDSCDALTGITVGAIWHGFVELDKTDSITLVAAYFNNPLTLPIRITPEAGYLTTEQIMRN